MQQASALACTLSLVSSALLLRAALQIRKGTLRHREFPPRSPDLLRPPGAFKGSDAERRSDMLFALACFLAVGSFCLIVGSVSVILRTQ